MAILIFANGEMPANPEWLTPYFAKADIVIAADGGWRHVHAAGKTAQVVIGDFDSMPANWQPPDSDQTQLIKYPSHKDETDLELALLYVHNLLDLEQRPIFVFGAFGGRLDQTFANFSLAGRPELLGRQILFVEPNQKAWLAAHHTTIAGKPGDTISLIPLFGDTYIISTNGLKWQLQNEWLRFGYARGVSNQLISNQAEIIIGSGLLMCVHIWQEEALTP